MAAEQAGDVRIDVASLPDNAAAEMDFRDTSFFQSGDPSLQLPSPASILQQHPGKTTGNVRFEHLNLLVKMGYWYHVRFEEVQTLRAMRQVFANNEVPVPEVCGWRKHGNMCSIYMSLIPGQTLDQAWPTLTNEDKGLICADLSRIVGQLRRLVQGPSGNCFVGSINGGTLLDRFFRFDYEEGPFPTVKSFNDWFFAAATRQRPGPGKAIDPGPYRHLLPDTGNIYFAHGDLTLTNIMISDGPAPRRISAILDWEQSGWFPEYWEYCKLLYAVDYEHGWRVDGWADKVMKPFPDEWELFAEWSLWRCP
ncbi:hypothetical protein E4U43_003163 [Claviceps pusilla]|uniref:Aminoglycoside phosphotransferase domain-containing protein n=1 Tax=Claviceps pusilla TaxID=123648 RepID=A0A9P7N546_9HYPO|nr:hypothetical protein E4U43_003163 [Claviceps pusilla]